MDLKLPNSISSQDELQLLKLEINRIIDLSREQRLRKTTSPSVLDISPQLKALLSLHGGDAIPGMAGLEKLQQMITHAIKTAPVVHLTLPALPSQLYKTEVVDWFRQNIHPQTLLVFEYNRSLAGGFALRLGGQVLDYSFRRSLLASPSAMVKAMKHV